MLIYFDRQGAIREVVSSYALSDGTVSFKRAEGNSSANRIYCYFEGLAAALPSATAGAMSYRLPDGTIIGPRVSDALETLSIDFDASRDLRYFAYDKDYAFLRFDVPDEVFSLSGLISATASVTIGEATHQFGPITFMVDGEVLAQADIDYSQWQYLISQLARYLPLSGGTMSGAIISEGTGRKATFGDGILKLEDTVYGRETTIGKYAITADGGNFYYPPSAEAGGTLITDKWSGFSEYAKKADLEGYATKADLEGYATKADLGNCATKKDLDDLKSIVYGIHSLTYNSYEFPYLTTSIIPDEVDGRKVVGGSYAIADWVGGNSLRWTTNILGSNGPMEYVIESGASGKNIYLANSSGTWREPSAFSGDMDAKSDHKYLAIVRYDETVAPASGSLSPLLGFWNGDNSYTRANLLYSDGRYRYGVFTPNKDYLGCACVFQRFDANKAKCTISDFRAAIWDLTANGDESLTDAQAFEKYKEFFDEDTASDYSESIKSTIITKIESWGYNLCNEIFESGTILRGEDYPSNLLKRTPNANKIRVIAGEQYTLEGDYTGNYYIFEFDYNMNYIRRDDYNNSQGGSVTLLSNCAFVRLVVPTDATNVCFHLTGTRTGYAPYVGKLGEISIPNAPLRLDGVNDIHNTLTFEEQSDGTYNAILTRKIGEVDLGTLNWTLIGTSKFQTQLGSDAKGASSNSEKANILTEKYTIGSWSQVYTNENKVLGLNTSRYLAVTDTDYTDVASFKTAMSGVNLYYELATPTTETIATGLTFDQASFPIERGGAIVAVYEEVPPTASIDFMTKGE